MAKQTKRKYGWVPDVPDQRDVVYKASKPVAVPNKVDLRDSCPPVYDQGELGSCTGQAIGAAFHFDSIKQDKTKAFMPSRLFIYYNERVMEGTVKSDNGAAIRDGIKSINKLGVCPEDEWPYIISKFDKMPKAKCYLHALQHKAATYQRVVGNFTQVSQILAQGFPIVFGISIYESFESEEVAKTGIVPMPSATEKLLGGHAVLCVGYDKGTEKLIVRNSWGEGWGIKGYFMLPFNYLQGNLSDDFWVVQRVML